MIPLWLKIAYTLFVCVLVPIYWRQYGLANPRENVNWVYGFGEQQQTTLPAPLFVLFLMLLFPLVIYFSHASATREDLRREPFLSLWPGSELPAVLE